MKNLIFGINKLFKDKKYDEVLDFLQHNSIGSSIWGQVQIAKVNEKLTQYEISINIYKKLLEETSHSTYAMEIGRLYTKLGRFSDKTEAFFLKAIELSNGKDGKILFEYYLFLFDSRRLTKEKILKYYEPCLFTDIMPSHKAWMASIFLEINEKEISLFFIDMLYFSKDRKILLRFLNLLVLINERKYNISSKEEELILIYKTINQNLLEFKKAILKYSISIVGNSPCEEGKGKGKHIDSAELVARFNNYPKPKDKNFIDDYGKQTDIWVRSIGGWVEERNVSNYKFIVMSGLNLLSRSTNWTLFKPYFSENTSIVVLPLEYEKELIHHLDSPPSAGISLLFYIYKITGKIEGKFTHGFSFTDQLKDDFVNIGGTIAGIRHEWEQEKKLFDKMLNNTM